MDSVRTLLAINFINSLCAGLIAPVLTTHLIAHGGSQISAGFMVTGIYVAERRSKDFLALFEHGSKFRLQFSFLIASFAYFILVYATSHWIILFCILLGSLTNRINATCKTVLKSKGGEKDNDPDVQLLDVTSLAADVLGCILGGYIFVINKSFLYNAMLNTLLNISGLFLVQNLNEEELGQVPESTNEFPNLYNNCRERLKDLQSLDVKNNWDAIMLKTAFVASFRIFLTKFALLITSNYGICTVILGYTIAYQHMLMFAAANLILFNVANLDKRIFDSALLFCSFTLMGLYFAPTYDSYLLIVMPMICAYTLVNNLMNDCLDLNNTDLGSKMETMTEIVNIITPILFGFIAEFTGVGGFKILAVLPPAACIFIINRHIIKGDREPIKTD